MKSTKMNGHSPSPSDNTDVHGSSCIVSMLKMCCAISIYAFTALQSPESHALTYTWPVLTSVTIEQISSTSATYKLKWTTVQIHDPTIGETESAVDVYNRKMSLPIAYNLSSSVVARRYVSGRLVSGRPFGVTRGEDTFAYWASLVTRASTQVETIVQSGKPDGQECVGLVTGPNAHWEGVPWSTLMLENWDAGVGGAAACLGTPPPNQWCALETPTLTFDYGVITLQDAVGATKTKNVNVSCTTGMKYTLRLRGENTVPLSNGMHAGLTANGAVLNTPLTGVAGSNTVNITSTLQGVPESAGDFRGESVLFISYP